MSSVGPIIFRGINTQARLPSPPSVQYDAQQGNYVIAGGGGNA